MVAVAPLVGVFLRFNDGFSGSRNTHQAGFRIWSVSPANKKRSKIFSRPHESLGRLQVCLHGDQWKFCFHFAPQVVLDRVFLAQNPSFSNLSGSSRAKNRPDSNKFFTLLREHSGVFAHKILAATRKYLAYASFDKIPHNGKNLSSVLY
jgi:hypothetical protein